MSKKRKKTAPRRALIQFHVTPAQRKKLHAAAKKRGVSRAELMRACLRGVL